MHQRNVLLNQNDEEAGHIKVKILEPKWNKFDNEPRKPEIGTNANSEQYEFFVKAVKLMTYIVVACVILLCAILSKATLLLMTSQIKSGIVRSFCNTKLDVERKFIVELPIEERVLWTWVLMFTYFVPQILTFIKALNVFLFKKWDTVGIWKHLPVLFSTETLPAVGSALLVFCILPELDVVKSAMLTNAFCVVPGIVGLIYRNPKNSDNLGLPTVMILDITCLISQLTAFCLWPLLENNTKLYLIPISAIFISFGWWQNYVDETTQYPLLQRITKHKKEFSSETYLLYMFISITNCAIFFISTLVIFWIQEGEIFSLFNNFNEAFSYRVMNVTQVEHFVEDLTPHGINDMSKGLNGTTEVDQWTPLTIFLVNIISSYVCYAFVKFASKASIQKISFALPISLTVPVLLSILIGLSGEYLKDECAYSNILPGYLFFTPPPFYLLRDFLTQQYAWAWLLWLLSQVWITHHVWIPRGDNLARTEKLFFKPMYDPFLIDQSVCMNRRKDHTEHKKIEGENESNYHPKIIVCATMWREQPGEMMTFMESIMRLDDDHCDYLIADSYRYNIPYNYDLETHVFFDQAFSYDPKSDEDRHPSHLNKYVLSLIETLDNAAKEVHGLKIRLRPPKIYSTPYGGRFEWILPGKSKFTVHLKDSVRIRTRKRWSQVMYLYFLIGYRIKGIEAVNQDEFDKLSKNVFILALDGDIDFKPQAVHLLIELMKINENLGAACGRIHPVGSGALAWYQVFEYAVGHWLQKATEHVIGCVLCSPGCFSLFRALALSQNGVMAKYTTIAQEARHRVQYDQGEDRWLCTLILKAGYRVEYSAASDSYTHCPEQFEEFYKQRKRWIPSTMANIVDVLEDHRYIVKNNGSISMIYIYYQTFLLIGTIIGPGTIFLMLVGATVTVFQMDQWTSFLMNVLPILIFVLVCSLCSAETQIKVVAVLSSLYGLLMMAVLIGVLLQIQDDGIMAPTSLFFFFMVAEFVVAALIHPKEFYCLKYGIIYYVTVPSMYMLLMIYSVFNVHDVSWGTRDEGAPKSNVEDSNEDNVDKNKKKSGKNKKRKKNLKNSIIDLVEVLKASKKNVEQQDEQKPSYSKTNTTDASAKSEKTYSFGQEVVFGCRVREINSTEEEFWKELIKRYLKPINEEEPSKVKKMEDLRDRMVSSFFMINALFVLVVFVLTLKKDLIHINWPYNANVNFTYIQSENEVQIMKDYLHLEPIGFVFLLTFGSLLVIQSFGMLIHRFGTFTQIIANTNMTWFEKRENDVGQLLKDITDKNAVKRIKSLRKFFRQKKDRKDINFEDDQVYDLTEELQQNLGKSKKEDYDKEEDERAAVQLEERRSMYQVPETPRDSLPVL